MNNFSETSDQEPLRPQYSIDTRKISTVDLINASMDESKGMLDSSNYDVDNIEQNTSDNILIQQYKQNDLHQTNNDEDNEDDNGPVDRCNLVYMIFVLWGIGTLLPFQSLINSFEYFESEQKDPKQDFDPEPSFVYPFAVNGLMAVAQIIMVLKGHKFNDQFKTQMQFLFASFIMVLLPVISRLLSPVASYYVCFAILLVCGFSNGVLTGQVFALASQLPSCMGAIMLGQGLCGILMNIIKGILILALPGKEYLFDVAAYFFIISSVVLWVCAICHNVLFKNQFFMHYKSQSTKQEYKRVKSINLDSSVSKTPVPQDQTGALRPSAVSMGETTDNQSYQQEYDNILIEDLTEEEREKKRKSRSRSLVWEDNLPEEEKTFGEFWQQFKVNFKSASSMLMGIFLTFFITLMVFPGSFLKSPHKFLKEHQFSWNVLFIISLFNVCDTAGRQLGGMIHISKNKIICMCLCRIIFVPITLLIMVYGNSKEEDEMTFWDQDWLKIVNLIFFAITNGYVSTQCAIKAPQMVEEDQKMQIGIFVSLFFALGIICGAILAAVVGSSIGAASAK